LVRQLISNSQGQANATDSNSADQLGIAITAVAAGLELHVSTDGGNTWSKAPTLSDTAALLQVRAHSCCAFVVARCSVRRPSAARAEKQEHAKRSTSTTTTNSDGDWSVESPTVQEEGEVKATATDINDNDSDPMPKNNGDNKHGGAEQQDVDHRTAFLPG
jgi:hypothetical protein